jgi:hypothetical protein
VQRYKSILETKAKFQQIEQMKVNQFVTYDQYGTFGFRLLFIPPPLSSLFYNAGAVSELTSFIDSGVRLRIYNSFLGKNLFTEKSGGFKDFSGILFLFGALFALYLGYESLIHKEYLKFLGSLLNHKRVVFAIICSRVIFLFSFFLVTTGCALLVMILNHIPLSRGEYVHLAVYMLVLFLTMLFFFFSGAAISSTRNPSSGIILIFLTWFVFVFIVPGVVQTIVSHKSHGISSNYKIEQEKLKVLMGFEKRAIARVGIYKDSRRHLPSVRELIEEYWEKDFKFIRELNQKIENEMRTHSRRFQLISLLFPSTFYLSVNNEIGGKGYESVLDFYVYNQEIKEKFIRYYFDKKFYAGGAGVESFIKKEENIFRSRSRLPGGFIAGIAVTLVYISGLSIFSYYRHRGAMFAPPGSGNKYDAPYDHLEIPLNSGQYHFIKIFDYITFRHIFSFISGENPRFRGNISLNGVTVTGGGSGDLVYVCQPAAIPGEISTRDLLAFVRAVCPGAGSEGDALTGDIPWKPFNQLENHQRGKVLLSIIALLAKKDRIFLFHNFECGMPAGFTRHMDEVFKELKNNGAAIIYFSNDAFFIPAGADHYSSIIHENGKYLYKDITT